MAICSIGELCIDTMIFKDFNRIEKNEEFDAEASCASLNDGQNSES